MSEVVLQTHGLRKHFPSRFGKGSIKAVDGVNIEVQRGDVFGFLGPNGAGKTTAIGMILGLLHPTSGSVMLFGKPITPTANAHLQSVGALIGTPALLPNFSARQNLELVGRLDHERASKRIDETLVRVGLSEAADRKAGKFSTGMKQRLGLAIALLHNPDLLILDEPTNGMDPTGMHDVRDLLRELAFQGVTIFLSSHLLHEVEQVCDHLAVLNKGKVVAQGAVRELLGGRAWVRVRVSSPNEAVPLLSALPGVDEVHLNGDYVEVHGVPSEAVVVHLTSNGVIPSEITNEQGDLESLFLELTQEE